jgi:hypothetical protein
METSFAMEGNYRGIPCTDVGTYTSVLREGGVLYGEGQGIITTKDGNVDRSRNRQVFCSRKSQFPWFNILANTINISRRKIVVSQQHGRSV